MKPVFSFLLAFWMLLGGVMPNNDAEELAKIPTLIRHYVQHNDEVGGSLDFQTFLEDHYTEKKECDTEHENLPFVKHSLPCLVYVIPHFSIQFLADFEYVNVTSFPEPNLFVSAHFLHIWQPPRLV
jgi:hypothetical protein